MGLQSYHTGSASRRAACGQPAAPNGRRRERTKEAPLRGRHRIAAGLRGGLPRLAWIAVLGLQLTLSPEARAALPTFENRTPTGFSSQDSTAVADFIEGSEVTVRVDLNQAATHFYPVIGNFHNLERSEKLSSTDVDGLRADVATTHDGIIHVAWLSQEVVAPVTTPVYFVRYARSNSNGANFSQSVSISGSLRFDILTVDGGGPSFSTLDLEVDSRGNPRVVYAFNHSPDGNTASFATNRDNVYLNHSEDGGANWQPANRAIIVSDTTGVVGNTEGGSAAFPRMVIDQRDNIFITYVRGSAVAGTGDIMVAKVNRATSPFTMEEIGSAGTLGSSGGVRLTPDGTRQTGPDIDVGTGDVLHVIFYNDGASDIEHKTLLADSWERVDVSGWDQGVDGADVDDFVSSPAGNTALDTDATFYFPTVVVDKQSSPDRVYAFYKFGDSTPTETVFFNNYVYDNAKGGSAGWLTAQASAVWSTAASPVFASGDQAYNIELDWKVTDRISAVVDDRRSDRGDIHIVFTAGYSNSAVAATREHDIYYGFYNGQTWTLPEKVADDDAGTVDGIDAADIYQSAPAIAKRTDDPNLYMVFAAGTGEGLGVSGVTDVNQHPYFKVLGRAQTSEDQSVPVGGFQYDLTYTPVNPQDATTDIDDNAVYVHVADNSTGDGLGAAGRTGDGFLAGDWETVATTLTDDDKNFEGRFNEDPTPADDEWGDDNDKIDLLVKLNVLGTDSSTNLQVVTNSTASDAGTGLGSRSVRVGTDPTGSFVSAGDFFLLGADIDIIDSNTAPTVKVTEPDGTGDIANTAYTIQYELTDPDDDITSTGLQAALYFSEHSNLVTVQDIRIFGTLIVDENDNTTVFASGTNDFTEGKTQTYRWGDPSAALKAKLFASIHQTLSGNYYIYLVADDRKNPPVYARSDSFLTIVHRPIIDFLDPAAGLDTVDTGVRTGELANPYDLDFTVRDFDRQGSAEVQLFYSAVSGLSSITVECCAVFPDQIFHLGGAGSEAGVLATAITNSDTLTSTDTQFSWDVSSPSVVAEGAYFIYIVSSDSVNHTVGQSQGQLLVKHSPSFTFYDPPRDTHRRINSGSQPVFTVQWQKGTGDQDFDDDATIDLYFTTDNPATVNFEDFPDSLLKDSDTRTIVKGLNEDLDGGSDMYVWNFRNPPNEVPSDGQKVWLYTVISDSSGNKSEVLGGALTVFHSPYINLLTSKLDELGSFDLNDVLRVEWDDYLVDDGVSTDDAFVRIYATESPSAFSSQATLDSAVDGITTFLLNSSNGTKSGTVTTIRESDSNFFDWNTKLFGNASTDYDLYVGIAEDESFVNNLNGAIQLSKSSTALTVGAGGATPNISLSPSDLSVAIGDTFTFDVMVQHSQPINLVQIVIKLEDNIDFLVIDQDDATAGTQPFIDLDNVFAGTDPIENTFLADPTLQLRFAKSTFTGAVVGTTTEPVALARFQLDARDGMAASPGPMVVFTGGDIGTVLGVVGQAAPFQTGSGLATQDPELKKVSRGKITATVKLEGRSIAPATGDHTTLLDVHLRLPGSTVDILEDHFVRANDDDTGTADTLEVGIDNLGALSLVSVPAGRYVMTVKDTSHVSGRTDTITVRLGETVSIFSAGSSRLFGSDLRGDPTSLLPLGGTELIAGDATEDNEINEDDVNLIVTVWGAGGATLNHFRSDINNDGDVGAADMTVTTSNFGNSEGFGAPPVFKRGAVPAGVSTRGLVAPPLRYGKPVPRGDNSKATVELRPLFNPLHPPRAGQVAGFEIAAVDLDDVAGYEFEIEYGDDVLRAVPGRATKGDIFAANPYGSVFETREVEGGLAIMASRVGKEWSAQGEGILAQLWFEVLSDEGLGAIELGDGLLLDPAYRPREMRRGTSLVDLLLPDRPSLEQNFPNPFNPSTSIPIAVPLSQAARLDIYNVLGQRIRTLMAGPVGPGIHTIIWNGRDDAGRSVAAGLYFSVFETAEFRQTRKMMMVK